MNSFRCPQCGFLNFAEAEFCKRCKTEFTQTAVNASVSEKSESGFAENATAFRQTVGSPSASFQPPRSSFQPPQHSSAPSFGSSYQPQNKANSDAGKKTGMATASLVLGIIGFFTIGLLGIGAVTGVILGGIALQRANKKPDEYGGKGLSIAGIALNCLSFVSVFFIGIIAAIAIPNLLAARRAANEGSAIYGMRTLLQAESAYMSSSASQRCGDLTELLGAKLIDTALASSEKSGYKYVIAKNANGSCELFAAPLVASGAAKSGTRSFYASTDEWEIHAADKNGAPASKSDPLLRMLENNGARRNRAGENDY